MHPTQSPFTADPLRLAALHRYAVLDTPPEPGFDDLVHLAAQACAAPVALVSLVDRERQWFKARVGFPACETDLDSSVCKYVLDEQDILIIPDLAADRRTAANPLVTGTPSIRFYAGAPLRSTDDHVLGSLCIIDTVPRPDGLTADQADSLRRFARQVVGQLELRSALAARDALLAEQAKFQLERQTLAATQAVIAAAGGDIDSILDALLAGAMEAIPTAEAGVVELIDGDELVYRAVRGSNARHRGLRLPLRGSLAGRCVETNAPMLVADALADPHVKRDLIAPLGLSSILVAPLSRGNEVLGVLQLQSSKPSVFDSRDLEVTRLFAGIANAGLTEVREAAARRTIEASEIRYRAIFESAIDYAIVVLDLEGRVTNWNSGARNIMGWSAEEMIGRRAEVFFTPEDRVDGIAATEMRAALDQGRGQDERWHLRKSGEQFWASGEMMALRDKDRHAVGFVKILRDQTDRRRIEAETRRLAAIVEQSGDFIGVAHLDGTVAWVNEAGRAMVGLAGARQAQGTIIADYFDPADWDHIAATVFPAVEANGRWRGELRFRHFVTGALIPVIYDVIAMRDDAGKVTAYATVTRDNTLQKRVEARQDLLNQELAHRLKNTLAMVQAIVAQTLRHTTDPATAREVLTERLVALGKAHDILMSGHGESAEIKVIIAKALELHDDGQLRRFRIEGPYVVCGSKAALALALMIHELATNAAKYGALSTAAGHVVISWQLKCAANEETLTLIWQEQGGPAVSTPTRQGFGSRLIQRGLAGVVDGEVTMSYPPDGVICTLTGPLAGFQNEG